MEEQTTTTTETPPVEEPPKVRTTELTRASTERILGGVAEGISRRTGIWTGWVRAAFVLTAFAGGLGIAVYAAAWFLIRSDDEPDSIAERFFARTTTTGSWVGVGFVFIALLILLDNVWFLSGGVIWAVGLLVLGLLLYSGDLPRLTKSDGGRSGGTEADDGGRSLRTEGVQQVTTTTETPEVRTQDEVVGGGANVTLPPPPPPTPVASQLPLPPAKPRESSILGRLTFGVMAIALGILAALDNGTNLVDPAPRHYIALAVTILGIGLIVGAFAGRARWLILVGVLALPFLFASPGLEYEYTETSAGTTYVTPTGFEDLDGAVFHQSIGEMVVDLRDLPWAGEGIEITTDMGIGQTTVLIPEDITVTGSGTVSIGRVNFESRYSAGLDAGLGFQADGTNGSLDLTSHVGIGSLNIQRISAES